MKKVDVYTGAYCPFCIKAKELLKKESVPFNEIDISGDQGARDLLMKKSKIRTVPQIFVNDEFIGDCNQIHQLHRDGEFDAIFK